MVGAAADVSALSPLDHRDDGFDLGSPSISVAVEANLHQSTVTAFGGLGRRSRLWKLTANNRVVVTLMARSIFGRALFVGRLAATSPKDRVLIMFKSGAVSHCHLDL